MYSISLVNRGNPPSKEGKLEKYELKIALANVTLIKIAHTLFQVYLFVFVAQLFHQSKLDNNHPLPPLNNEKEHQ